MGSDRPARRRYGDTLVLGFIIIVVVSIIVVILEFRIIVVKIVEIFEIVFDFRQIKVIVEIRSRNMTACNEIGHVSLVTTTTALLVESPFVALAAIIIVLAGPFPVLWHWKNLLRLLPGRDQRSGRRRRCRSARNGCTHAPRRC